MGKFKVGDTVKRINGSNGAFKEGEVDVITEVVRNFFGTQSHMPRDGYKTSKCFDTLNDERNLEIVMPKFKIGDLVERVELPNGAYGLSVGEQDYITKIEYDQGDCMVTTSKYSSSNLAIYLKLVETPKNFSLVKTTCTEEIVEGTIYLEGAGSIKVHSPYINNMKYVTVTNVPIKKNNLTTLIEHLNKLKDAAKE